jgi:hypothetical protein
LDQRPVTLFVDVKAVSGAFVVIALGGVVVFGGDTPDTGASAAKVVSYYSDHTTRQSIAGFLLAASVPFLVLFEIYLASFSGRGNDAGEAILWRRLLIRGTVIEAAMLLATALIHFALTGAVDQGRCCFLACDQDARDRGRREVRIRREEPEQAGAAESHSLRDTQEHREAHGLARPQDADRPAVEDVPLVLSAEVL